MNPQDKLAELCFLAEGLTAAITATKNEVRALRDQLRIKGGFVTDRGDITFSRNNAKIKFNSGRLLEWAKANMPHEVVPEHVETVPESVRATLYTTLEDRLEIDGDEVIDTQTGESVDFASVEPGKPDSVVFTMPRQTKVEAAEVVLAHVEALAASLPREIAA